MIVGRDADVASAAVALAEPGLVVVAGGPGIGRSTVIYAAAGRSGRTVHAGGGLITLRHRPYLPLARAIRAPLPPDDRPLAVEAVRARVGRGVLLLDDLQWADRATLDLLGELAGQLPIIAAIRTPAPLTGPAAERLRNASTHWLDLALLPDAAATGAVRDLAPTLPAYLVAQLVATAEGNPAVLTALARAAVEAGPGAVPPPSIAALVAELPQDERTALAALGLLARPATPALLGRGGRTLIDRGLVVPDTDGTVSPRERIVAEVAAGVLPAEQRAAMHRRLAELVTEDGEAARHLAAAGESAAAAARAAQAADRAGSLDSRADYLELAAAQQPAAARVLAAARAALAAGRTVAAAVLLAGGAADEHPEAAVLKARIALLEGDPAQAKMLLDGVAGRLAAVPELRAEQAAVGVRAETALDPAAACTLAEYVLAETAEPGAELLTAYGEALRRAGRPDWEQPLRRAAQDPDRAAALASSATLVAGLREMLRTAEAGTLAAELAQRCADDAAYSWELNFTAELLWCRLHRDGALDDVIAEGGRLVDHSLPAPAAQLLGATLGLARGDGGALAAARGGLTGSDRLTGWVRSELAWLDGDPAGAQLLAGALLETGGADLAASLAAVTAWWAGGTKPAELSMLAAPVAAALQAVQAGDFTGAAAVWDGVMLRERIRTLLGAGDTEGAEAVDALLLAERLADEAGLAVLLGRARRALRKHGVARRPARPAEGTLSAREYEVMALVADGQSSRRIADRLGLRPNTVETYVRSAMGKLGAKTRTEAAVRAGELAQR